MSLRTNLTKTLEKVLGIPASLGLRPWTVSIVSTSSQPSSVAEYGEATAEVETETPITIDSKPPRIKPLPSSVVVASSGLYQESDLIIGPIPQDNESGGFTFSDLNPLGGTISLRISDSIGFDGTYKIIASQIDSSLTYSLIARRIR